LVVDKSKINTFGCTDASHPEGEIAPASPRGSRWNRAARFDL
jgi:hypothetical protein